MLPATTVSTMVEHILAISTYTNPKITTLKVRYLLENKIIAIENTKRTY